MFSIVSKTARAVKVPFGTTRALSPLSSIVPAVQRTAFSSRSQYQYVSQMLRELNLTEELDKFHRAKIDDDLIYRGLVTEELLKEARIPPGARCKILPELPVKHEKIIYLRGPGELDDMLKFEKSFKSQEQLERFLALERIPGLLQETKSKIVDEYNMLENGKTYIVKPSILNANHEAEILRQADLNYMNFAD